MPQQSPAARAADLPYLPPPPPPENVRALLRWSLAVLKASTGRDRAVVRRHQAGPGGGESLGTVAVAIGADLAMFAAKAAAAALTGSAALFAETLHSLADTGNQLLLLTGLRRARRRPDARHPFGYGAELFYWSLLAALGLFAVGGVLSAWEGAQRLLHPSGVQAGPLGFAVLGLGCLLDGTSWLTSVHQLRREARARGVPFRQHLRTTTDTVQSRLRTSGRLPARRSDPRGRQQLDPRLRRVRRRGRLRHLSRRPRRPATAQPQLQLRRPPPSRRRRLPGHRSGHRHRQPVTPRRPGVVPGTNYAPRHARITHLRRAVGGPTAYVGPPSCLSAEAY